MSGDNNKTPIVGVAGKQYGLILKSQPKTQLTKLKPSIFQEEDETETVEQQIKRESEKKKQLKKVRKLYYRY